MSKPAHEGDVLEEGGRLTTTVRFVEGPEGMGEQGCSVAKTDRIPAPNQQWRRVRNRNEPPSCVRMIAAFITPCGCSPSLDTSAISPGKVEELRGPADEERGRECQTSKNIEHLPQEHLRDRAEVPFTAASFRNRPTITGPPTRSSLSCSTSQSSAATP
jgi:hypothetical protein